MGRGSPASTPTPPSQHTQASGSGSRGQILPPCTQFKPRLVSSRSSSSLDRLATSKQLQFWPSGALHTLGRAAWDTITVCPDASYSCTGKGWTSRGSNLAAAQASDRLGLHARARAPSSRDLCPLHLRSHSSAHGSQRLADLALAWSHPAAARPSVRAASVPAPVCRARLPPGGPSQEVFSPRARRCCARLSVLVGTVCSSGTPWMWPRYFIVDQTYKHISWWRTARRGELRYVSRSVGRARVFVATARDSSTKKPP